MQAGISIESMGAQLQTAKAGAGLSIEEADALFGGALAERRGRHPKLSLGERVRLQIILRLMETVAAGLGGWEYVGPWLRGSRAGVPSALSFCSGSVVQLRALLAIVQDELR